MTQLPTNRSTSSTVAEHVADHDTLAASHNKVDGLWFSVMEYGAAGDGTTDDTTAVRNALAAAVAAGGGTVFFPAGTYRLSGALQDTSVRNAVIPLPLVPISTTDQPLSIEFAGAAPPFMAPPATYLVDVPTRHPVTIFCDTAASGTEPSIFGAGISGGAFSNILVTFRNLCIRQPNNPALVGIHGESCENVIIERCAFDVNARTGQLVQPTHSNGRAVWLPGPLNSAISVMRDVNIWGYFAGVIHSSCARLDNVFIQQCVYGVELSSYGIVDPHPATWHPLVISGCATAIFVAAHAQVFGELDIEDAAAGHWWSPVNHIDGGGGTPGLMGEIVYNRVIQDVGLTQGPLTLNANPRIHLKQLTAPIGSLTVAVPATGVAVSSSPYDRTFYVTAATGGCTMAIENGPSPVIPAATLGTIRVPAGKTVTPTFTNAPTWVVEGH